MKEVIFLSDVLLAIISIIWVFVATMQDIKKREVANWLSFSLVIISLSFRAIASIISMNVQYFLWGIAATIIFFGIANLFYYSRIFAGGDAKLLIALGATFATTPIFTPILKGNILNTPIFPFNVPFLFVFISNMLFVGSAYGLLFAVFLALKNFSSFRKDCLRNGKRYLKGVVLFALLGMLLILANKLFFADDSALLIAGILIIMFPFLFVFIKSVENACMIKLMKPSELTEGDWIVDEMKIGRRAIKPRFSGLDKNEILILKKRNKRVIIKQGIPFVPVFFIALLLSFFTNLLELLIIAFV